MTELIDRFSEIYEKYYNRHHVSNDTIRKLVPLCIFRNDKGRYDFDYVKFINLMPIDELIGILEVQTLTIYDQNDCCDFFADNALPCCIDWMILEFEFEKHTGQSMPATEDWGYYMHELLDSLYMKFKEEFEYHKG